MAKNTEVPPDLLDLARAPLNANIRLVARLDERGTIRYAVETHTLGRAGASAERSVVVAREDVEAILAIADAARRG